MVIWIITPIVLHERAVFQCQLVGDTFERNVTRKWDLDDKLLSYNGYSTDNSKYTEELYSNGFGLVVHNFTESDLEKTYTCFYRFLQNSTKLSFREDLVICKSQNIISPICKLIYIYIHDSYIWLPSLLFTCMHMLYLYLIFPARLFFRQGNDYKYIFNGHL